MNPEKIKQILKKQGEIVVYKLEEMARTNGDNHFYYYGEQDKTLTFKEFNKTVNCIAHNLSATGIKKGDRICFYLVNQMVSALVMFATWKIGAVYCPVNFNYHGKLLSFQINDTDPVILVTEQSKVAQLNQIKERIPGLDVIVHHPMEQDHDYSRDAENTSLNTHFSHIPFISLVTGNSENPGTVLKYDDVANIIYTSGTTGNPKGCVQTHRWMQNYNFYFLLMKHPDEVIYNDLPLYHVAGAVMNIARAAWSGCKVACWDRFSPNDFWDRIKKSHATQAILIDVMMPWLMLPEETPQDRFNTLKIVNMQPLVDYHREFSKRFGIDIVATGYGQSEAGCGCVCMIDEELDDRQGTPRDLLKGLPVMQGRQIARQHGIPVVSGRQEIKKGLMGRHSALMEAAVFDDSDTPLGFGEKGQLVFRQRLSHVHFLGYFNNPEATQKTLQGGWLHTGDGAYQDKDGIFYFIDRIGGFIRRRGENITAAQIEGIVNDHPKIHVSCVFPVPSDNGHEDEIVLYTVLKPGEKLSEQALREWLQTQMPKFMWPDHIRFTKALPVTPTFKVKKHELKEEFLKAKNRS